MRRLKLQMQTTLDGYVCGLHGEMDWMGVEWSDDMTNYVSTLTDGVDTIVLGRVLAEGFIPHWASGPEWEPQESIDFMNSTPKLVLSSSLGEAPWENTRIISDVAAEIAAIKNEPGRDLIVYGGSGGAGSLIEAGLVDDLHLFVHPVSIGNGKPIFPSTSRQQFQVAAVTPFECGVTGMHLQPAR